MSEARPGYVYVLSARGGSTKVGRSHSPAQRRRTLVSVGGFVDHEWWVSTALHEDAELERLVHQQLAEHRVVGEWFSCDFTTAVKAVESQRAKFGEFCKSRSQAALDEKKALAQDMIGAFAENFIFGSHAAAASLDGVDLTGETIMSIAVWAHWQKSPATGEEREEAVEFLEHIVSLAPAVNRADLDDWIEEVRVRGASMMAKAVAISMACVIPKGRMYTDRKGEAPTG